MHSPHLPQPGPDVGPDAVLIEGVLSDKDETTRDRGPYCGR